MSLTHAGKSVQVIARFCLRIVILAVFTSFGSIGFAHSLTVLLWMSAILSAALAAIKREHWRAGCLNHWDEMAAYAALCCLMAGLDGHPVPI